jgi:uncharacterized protein
VEYLLICAASLLVSIVTLFSGFGLGTVLMPVFAIFFPLPIAIASTAVVHLANNFFKAAIVGKFANWNVVLKFGIPAALASAIGAYLLGAVSFIPPVFSYSFIQNHEFKITYIGITVGLIIILSSLFELIPTLSELSFPSKYISFGGALSGFFGGISGNQGILRSAFLIKAGLSKEEFIGTSVIASIFVDIIRLFVYGFAIYFEKFAYVLSREMQGILIASSLTAFLGSYIGSKLIHKITFKSLQMIVGLMLLILGTAIALGIA